MNYKQLQKNYYILTPIKIDEKTVFICRNKNTFLYEFFCKINNEFIKVDNELDLKLKQIYHETTKDYVEFYVSNNYNSTQKERIINIHRFCKSIILKNISNLPDELQEKITKYLDTVTYVRKPINDKYIFACYQYNDNSINLNFDSSKINYDISRILHELLHCSSASTTKKSTGFLSDRMMLKNSNIILRINEYINEAYTEILRERFLAEYPEYNYDKNFTSLYSPIKAMLGNLVRFVDSDKLDVAYFSSGGYEMLDILAKEFHLKNSEDIIRLSLLFDAAHDSLIHEYPSRTNLYPYTRANLFAIGKLICELVLNKYQEEGKDISKLQFVDIFRLIPNPNIVDKIYNDSLIPLTRYFDFLKGKYINQSHSNNLSINSKDYLNNYVALFLDCASKNIELPLDFPEEAKSAELFNLALSKRVIKNGKFIALNDFENILKNVLDPNNNFLPLDVNEQTAILNTLIYNQNIPIDKYSKYYPSDILANLANTNLAAFDIICQNDIFALFKILDKLHPARKTTRMFYINFLKAISTKINKMDLLKFYFESLTPNQQKSLTQNGNFVFLAKENAKLNKQEFLDFRTFVENLSKANQNDIIY